MLYITPWMPNYPDIFNNITIKLLHEKYYEILRFKYISSFYQKYMPLSEDIYSYINNNTFPLSTTIKFLLKTIFNNCIIVNSDYDTTYKFKYNNIIFAFKINNISETCVYIFMTYNSIEIKHNINSIDDFNIYFIKPFFNNDNIILTDKIIKKSYEYCVEVKLKMAIFVIWLSESDNVKYLSEYNKLNQLVEYDDSKLLECKIFSNHDIDNEFDDLLKILINSSSTTELKIDNEIAILNEELEKECSICLNTEPPQDDKFNEIIILPCCNYKCHLYCIKQWFNKVPTCCNCRKEQYESDKHIKDYINQLLKEKRKSKKGKH